MPGADARAVGELIPGQALVVSEPQEHPPKRGGRKTRVRHGRLLPVRVRSRCGRLHARPEGGHGENTGQATGVRASVRPVRAFTSSRRPGRVPSDRRWPYRLRFVGVGVALRASTPLQLLGLARVALVLTSAPPRLGRLPRRAGDPLPLASWRSGDLPASPSAPPLRCPGAVTPRAFRSRLGPASAALSPEAADPSPAIGSLAMPRSEDQLAARLPAARDGTISAGHLPRVQRHGMAQDRGGRQRGEIEESWQRGRSALAGVSPDTDTIPPWTSSSEPNAALPWLASTP
jgi:hypothetical protein